MWPFIPVTLTLTRWCWYTNMTQILRRCTCRSKMKFLAQCFQKLEHKQDRQTDGRDRTHYQPHSRVITTTIEALSRVYTSPRQLPAAPPSAYWWKYVICNILQRKAIRLFWVGSTPRKVCRIFSMVVVWKDLSPKMTYYVSNGTLSPTHLLTLIGYYYYRYSVWQLQQCVTWS